MASDAPTFLHFDRNDPPDPSSWSPPPSTAQLRPTELHIFAVSLAPSRERARSLVRVLSPEERRRMEGFRSDVDRTRYAVLRGTLREILGRYLSEPPERVAVGETEFGKPRLCEDAAAQGLTFNVSRSDDSGLVVLGRGSEVGVDIEHVRPLPDLLEVAGAFFHRDEVVELESVSAEQVPAAFFELWVRKEAVIKAAGVGLSHPLADFRVTRGLRDVITLSTIGSAAVGAEPLCVTVVPLDLPGAVRAAVAWHEQAPGAVPS